MKINLETTNKLKKLIKNKIIVSESGIYTRDDIERVKGIKTMFFGGEGLFLTTLRGPGKVLIQSMSLSNLATALAPFLPHNKNTSGSSGIAGTLIRETLGR